MPKDKNGNEITDPANEKPSFWRETVLPAAKTFAGGTAATAAGFGLAKGVEAGFRRITSKATEAGPKAAAGFAGVIGGLFRK